MFQYFNLIQVMKNIFFFSAIGLVVFSCQTKTTDDLAEKWKQEIREAEQQFAQLVQAEGIHNGFVAFAAEDAVMMRNNKLVKGKEAIDDFYVNSHSKTLNWEPDFIEVSSSGDLAYTYGTYQYTFKDSTGTEKVDTGIFHTVWKRQTDGNWKFVWD